MKNTLVVFYSRTGHTGRVARHLAGELDADLEQITEPRSRAGVLGFLRSVLDSLRKSHPRIIAGGHRPGRYAQVVIGTPVWASHVSAPVRTYLAEHADEIKRVGFFCTYGGSGADATLEEMTELAGRAPVATLAITEREIDAHDDAKPAHFVQELLAHPA